MMGNYDKNQCLYIKWLDITSKNGWIVETEAASLKPSDCYSVGFFLNETDEVIRISDSVDDDGDRSVLVIPKGVVEYIIKMKKVDNGGNSSL